MKVNLKLKAYDAWSIRHQVHIALEVLEEIGNKYFLTIKKRAHVIDYL